jgi:uncharacterized protein YjdB
MASILTTVDCRACAEEAGLQTFVVSDTTLDVFSSDVKCLENWVSSNHITSPIIPHQLKPRTVSYKDLLTPLSVGVPYFYMNHVRSIYDTPNPTTANVVIGVVSFGGGLYGTVDSNGVLTNGDVQTYWSSIGIPSQNHPRVIVVPINGATNSPNFNDGGATIENTIDVEILGGMCPSANLTIILYISPNTLSNFTNLLTYMYNTNITVSGVNYKPTIISCSWGAPEIYYGSSLLSSINTIMTTITTAGISICCATGDNGSNDGVGGSGNYVDFPSSNPNSTAVGGTSLVCPNNVYDSQTVETTWSSGGGGISTSYSKPSYQSSLSVSGRSIPDVASLADPSTGVVFRINSNLYVIGGTSVAAPIVAGFLATINCRTFINPYLYQAPSNCFHDIITGSNGGYSAGAGYDSCTGKGSIRGTNLATYLATATAPILVSSITVNPTSVSMTIAQTQQITATVVPSNAANNTLSWSSSNTGVATVSSSGLITSVAAGSATITVQATDGSNVYNTVSVSVSANPILITGITLIPGSTTLAPGATVQMTTAIAPSNATNKTLTWSSSNTSIATVNSSGLVTAVAAGTANVWATSTDGSNRTGTCTITVSIAATSISLNQTTATMHPGNTLTLVATVLPSNATNKTVTWSSNSSNATVNGSGTITAISLGSAVITARCGSLTATCVISITVAVSSVSVSPTSISIGTVSTKTITATVLPSNAANKAVVWSSANPSIATVSNSGVVTGVNTGSTTITVQTVDMARTATVAVYVFVSVQSVSLNSTSISLALGSTFQSVATVLPSNATNKAVSWQSLMPSVATVSNTGLIRAVGNGSTVITVFTQDGNKSASVVVRVSTAATGVSLNRTALTLPRTATFTLVANVLPSNATTKTVSWSSNHTNIATVSSAGLVRGIATGTATITATTTDGGFTASCIITVL